MKIDRNRKIPKEKEMLDQLRQGKIQLPPLTIRLLDGQLDVGDDKRIDAYIEAQWKGNQQDSL